MTDSLKDMEPAKLQGRIAKIEGIDTDVEKVHVVYKSHIDIGFTGSSHKVVHDLINWQLFVAIDQAKQLREEGMERYFAWTLPSWFIWQALEMKKRAERKALEDAILRGDIAWTATPFTPHTEFMDDSLFEHAINVSKQLDKRFGIETIAAKFTDVPGSTIGMLKILAQNGIKLIHIGVNHMSSMPETPSEFVWRDKMGNEVIVMYCRGYGNTRRFPHSRQVLAQALKGDNMELPGRHEVIATIERLKQQYPNAIVKATSYSDFAKDVVYLKEKLPVVTAEIGDSWIHGVGSDPYKTGQYRSLSRLRKSWIESGAMDKDSNDSMKFSNNLMLIAEHTWGVSHQPHLHDIVNWDNPSFHSVKHRGNYRILEASWQEQRDYIEHALNCLNDSKLQSEAEKALDEVKPQRPVIDEMLEFDPSEELCTGNLSVKLCRETGAIISLVDKESGYQLAGPEHQLGKFGYQTFTQDDFIRFIKQYCFIDSEFLLTEFGKKGIENTYAKSAWWDIQPTAFYKKQEKDGLKIVVVLKMPEETFVRYGGAREVYNTYFISNTKKQLMLTLSWFDKTPTRLPEAFWYSINPRVAEPKRWVMDKMGYEVSPYDVIKRGGPKLHAVQTGVYYQGNDCKLSLQTLDAPLAAPGKPSLTIYDDTLPEMDHGWHFNLFNNIWNTNFVAWYGDDGQFRFTFDFDV